MHSFRIGKKKERVLFQLQRFQLDSKWNRLVFIENDDIVNGHHIGVVTKQVLRNTQNKKANRIKTFSDEFYCRIQGEGIIEKIVIKAESKRNDF